MFTQIVNKIQHKLVTKAPRVLTYPCQLLPFFIQQTCLNEILTHVFKEAIEDGDLDFLQGKWLKVAVSDLKLTWFLSFNNGAFIIKAQSPNTDVSFSASVNDLILVAGRKEDADTLFFQRRLLIEGNTELGLEIKNLLDNIEFDNFPPIVEKLINRFSDFVKVGLASPKEAYNEVDRVLKV